MRIKRDIFICVRSVSEPVREDSDMTNKEAILVLKTFGALMNAAVITNPNGLSKEMTKLLAKHNEAVELACLALDNCIEMEDGDGK